MLSCAWCQAAILCKYAFLMTVPLFWNWFHNLDTTFGATCNHRATSAWDWSASRLPTDSPYQEITYTIMRTHSHCKQANLFVYFQYLQNCRQNSKMLKRTVNTKYLPRRPIHTANIVFKKINNESSVWQRTVVHKKEVQANSTTEQPHRVQGPDLYSYVRGQYPHRRRGVVFNCLKLCRLSQRFLCRQI